MQGIPQQATQCPFAAKLPPLVWDKLNATPPKHSRRELRRLGRQFTLEEVAQHHYVNDVWIVVDGQVYDITDHLVNHHGWDTAGISTPLSILAHAGTDCSAEFHTIHRRSYPVAYKQLAAYYIGDLAPADRQQDENSSTSSSTNTVALLAEGE